jgi:hypothetical protein
MVADSENIPDGTLDAVAEGLRAYLTADAVRQLLEAIDIEDVLEGELEEEAVDSEEVGKVIGRLIGRMVAKELTSYVPLGQLIETTIGRVVGEKLGEAAVNAFIEYGDPEAVIDRVQTLIDNTDLDQMATDITTTAQESGLRDYLPSIGDNAEETWTPEDSTAIEITDEQE